MKRKLSDKEVGDLLLKELHRLPHFKLGLSFPVGSLGTFVPTAKATDEVKRLAKAIRKNPNTDIKRKRKVISLQMIKEVAKLHNNFKHKNSITMATKIPESKAFETKTVESGTYPAVLIGIAILGTLPKVWKGVTTYTKIVRLFWELPNEKYQIQREDEPDLELTHIITEKFTFSASTKGNLYKMLNVWSNGVVNATKIKDFDIIKMLGNTGALTVERNEGTNGKMYANFKGISPLMKGSAIPVPVREPFVFDVDEFTKESFMKLFKWVRAEVAKSQEFEKMGLNIDDYEYDADDSNASGGSEDSWQ